MTQMPLANWSRLLNSKNHSDWVDSHIMEGCNRARIDHLNVESDRWVVSEALRGQCNCVNQCDSERSCVSILVRNHSELHWVTRNFRNGLFTTRLDRPRIGLGDSELARWCLRVHSAKRGQVDSHRWIIDVVRLSSRVSWVSHVRKRAIDCNND